MGVPTGAHLVARLRAGRSVFRSRYESAVGLPRSASSSNLDVVSETKMDAVTISGSPKTLVKGVALVDLVAASASSVRQAELVERSGLPRPTAMRLIEALLELGLLDTDHRGDYRLGAHVALWGTAFRNTLDLAEVAADVMEGLSTELRETCYLGVRDGDGVLYLAAAHGPQAIRPAATVGARNPLHSTGIGKVLLAFLEPAERDALISRMTFVARTPRTATDATELQRSLDATVDRGYAIDDIENEEGIRCIAVPIRDADGRVVAGMSVSAPAYRFSMDDLARVAPAVMACATEISHRLGFPADITTPRERTPDEQ